MGLCHCLDVVLTIDPTVLPYGYGYGRAGGASLQTDVAIIMIIIMAPARWTDG